MLNYSLSRVLFFGGAFFALQQDQGPNLSGVWRSDPQKSQRADGRPPADMRLKIDQSGSDVTMIMRVSSPSSRTASVGKRARGRRYRRLCEAAGRKLGTAAAAQARRTGLYSKNIQVLQGLSAPQTMPMMCSSRKPLV